MNKKNEAFRLFDEGKRPGDPEVKALGLSAKTRYNYFQEYKRSRGASDNGANDFDDIAELTDIAWPIIGDECVHCFRRYIINI